MTTPTHHESVSVAEAKAFVDSWSRVWRERDGRAYAALLDKDCVLYNPFGSLTRDQLPGFVDSLIASLPDHRIVATRWGAISDGVLIEWVMTGTLPGGPIELRGADRYTLRGGKAIEGVAYFDPRPFLERKEAPAKP